MIQEPTPIRDEVAQRRVEIRQRWDRYEGKHPASLRVEAGEPDDNVTMNNLATIVDAGVDFLFGGETEFHVQLPDGSTPTPAPGDDGEDDEPGEDAIATTWLTKVWKANRKRSLLRKIATSGAIAGHVAVKILPDTTPLGMHRLVLIDPCDLDIVFDKRDIDKVIGYTIDQKIGEDHGSAILRREEHTLNENGAAWTVRYLEGKLTTMPSGLDQRTAVRWEQIGPDVAWPHPWSAIVDAQNLPAPHQYWGRPDLTDDIVHVNDVVNRVASNENKTLRHFAHPQPVATSEEPKKMQAFIDASIGSTMCLATGSTYNLVQMSTEGMTAAQSYRDALEDKLFEIARTPRIAAGKVDGIGALSGVALLILYRPLIAKTETKQDTYGDLLNELNERLLDLAGFMAELEVGINWPDVLPKNEKDEAETALMLRDLGVSRQTLLLRLGIDPDVEEDRMAEEATDPMGDAHGLLSRTSELQAQLDQPPPAVPQDDPQAA